MNDKPNNAPFREQLLSQEKNDPKFQQTFRQEVKKMYFEKLKISQRVAYVLSSLLIGFFTLFFWAMAKAFEHLQIEQGIRYAEPVRLVSTWAMYFSMTLILLCLWPAFRGKMGLRFYPKVFRFVSWMLILAIVLLGFVMADLMRNELDFGVANPTVDILGAAIVSVLIIIMGVYLLLSGRIDRGDIQNKTKLLELEYKLAALEEKLNQAK